MKQYLDITNKICKKIHMEKAKILMKGIKEDTNKWKESLYS